MYISRDTPYKCLAKCWKAECQSYYSPKAKYYYHRINLEFYQIHCNFVIEILVTRILKLDILFQDNNLLALSAARLLCGRC